jgi:hypothetical protein
MRPEPISGHVFRWAGGTLGIAYDYADGKHEAHAIAPDDLRIIRRLKWAGSLSYRDERVRRQAAWAMSKHIGPL